MRTLLLSTTVAAVVGLAGCAGGSGPGSEPESEPERETRSGSGSREPAEALTGTWQVASAQTAEGESLELGDGQFVMQLSADGEAVGQAACNMWNGNVQYVDDTNLRIGAVGLARQDCGLSGDAQRFEDRFVNGLTRTMEWQRDGEALVLEFIDGQIWEMEPNQDFQSPLPDGETGQ